MIQTSGISFSLYEIFAVIGLVQSVSVIVYILFRAGHIRHVLVPVLCFGLLATGFTFDFAYSRYASDFAWFSVIQSVVWLSLPAFSVLLMIQVAQLGVFPRAIYWINLFVPVFFVFLAFSSVELLSNESFRNSAMGADDPFLQAILIAGSLAGGICLLMLWLERRNDLEQLRKDTAAKGERYWLIISFIFINLVFLFVTLVYVSGVLDLAEYFVVRDILGAGMAYVASTSLFRIYPPSIKLERERGEMSANDEDVKVSLKLKELMDVDKVYQEQGFSRTDLSRELGVPEARVSRIVSITYQKSLPQIINEHRVRDSLQLLAQTDAQISVIAEQVGFNSVPTFNRVFKDIQGISPSDYRSDFRQDKK